MAERRMFSQKIIDSDAFLDMPLSTQALYFHLNMRADDDGFINNPRKIQRMIGCGDDDLKLLIAKSFVIIFDTGVIVIKHWRINNYIQKDRYKETLYQEEKSQLTLKENSVYSLADTECIQSVSNLDAQVRLGKDRIDKDSIGEDSIYISAPSAETAEPPSSSSPQEENADAVAFLPLVTGEEYGIKASDLDTWQSAYPAVDVMTELRKMRAWLDASPKNRKTRNGIKRFIVGWLGRSQNSAPRGNAPPSGSYQNKTAAMLADSYQMMQEWAEEMEAKQT